MQVKATVLGVLAATLLAGAAHALEFRSIGSAPAILYDAPSERGRRVFVAPRNMPVEVVLTYGGWTKIRDAAGDLSWVQSKSLVSRRHVVVSAANAKVHAAPAETSPLVFSADRGVVLEVTDPVISNWVRVRHRDGQSGFVHASQVWGD